MISQTADVTVYLFENGERVETAVSDRRILQSVRMFLGDPDAPLPPIRRQDGCKPRFERSPGTADDGITARVQFSVSHSGRYWACAVCTQAVGLDVQKIESRMRNDIASRFFHPDEADYTAKMGVEAFFDVWTAKESYVKYTGEGIGGRFSRFSVVADGRLRACVGGTELRFLALDPAYRMCLCAKKIGAVRMIFLKDR